MNMIEIIFTIILFVGLIGMSVIIFRKIPVLLELKPEEIKPGALEKIKEKIKNNGTLRSFSKEILLHKILSKFRILTLKTENKTSAWLKQLREKNKNKFSEDFWDKVRRGK